MVHTVQKHTRDHLQVRVKSPVFGHEVKSLTFVVEHHFSLSIPIQHIFEWVETHFDLQIYLNRFSISFKPVEIQQFLNFKPAWYVPIWSH